jgi:type II secretion system protein G
MVFRAPVRAKREVGMRRLIRCSSSCNSGFTLIELLVVVAIIGVLIGISMGTYSFATRKAFRNQAIADIERLSSALEEYRINYGAYPPASVSGYMTNVAFDSTRQRLTNDMPNAARDLRFVDPWLRGYIYTNIATYQYRVISLGPDPFDSADDLDNSSGKM